MRWLLSIPGDEELVGASTIDFLLYIFYRLMSKHFIFRFDVCNQRWIFLLDNFNFKDKCDKKGKIDVFLFIPVLPQPNILIYY